MLKNREVLLVSGKFNRNTLAINTESPSFLRLKQFDNVNAPTNTAAPTLNVTHNIYVTITLVNGKYEGNVRVVCISGGGNLEVVNDTNSYSDKKNTVDWLSSSINNTKGRYKNWAFISSEPEFINTPLFYNSTPTPPPGTQTITNEGLLKKYSQATLISTNINLYSPRGKFRGDDIKTFEKNDDLKSFGSIADTLHPTMFGDESVRLFDIIIRLILTHIHTPQMPLLETALSRELKSYTVDGNLQNLLSKQIGRAHV